MTEHSDQQWNNDEIAKHLKSAVDTLTPDVLDKIDLSTPQEIFTGPSKVTRIYRRMRTVAAAMAACLCVAVLSGGVALYQNRKVDSIIGIDVNPSIELSVNRNDKVLRVEAVNDDAGEILDEMDLKGVDVDIAVNALIGSMVRHGYLDDLDNAILVTVANDDRQKASTLRQDVVYDIESSLEEHQVQAVVYDQQAPTNSEVRGIAEQYGISYGKAYFLQELIDENDLAPEDMEQFAGMSMSEIAREITERSYVVRRADDEDQQEKSSRTESAGSSVPSSVPETSTESMTETGTAESSSEQTSIESGEGSRPSAPASGTEASAATEEDDEDSGSGGQSGRRPQIDYVDFDSGYLSVVFKSKVKWRNPTISVKDENGQSYSAKISDTGPDSCEIEIQGLPGGMDYTFTLGGVALRDGGSLMSIQGYFDTPDIASELTEPDETEEETREQPTTAAETPAPEETTQPDTTAAATEPQTQASPETTQAPETAAQPLSEDVTVSQ